MYHGAACECADGIRTFKLQISHCTDWRLNELSAPHVYQIGSRIYLTLHANCCLSDCMRKGNEAFNPILWVKQWTSSCSRFPHGWMELSWTTRLHAYLFLCLWKLMISEGVSSQAMKQVHNVRKCTLESFWCSTLPIRDWIANVFRCFSTHLACRR